MKIVCIWNRLTVFRQFKFATNYYLGEISKKNELYCTFFKKMKLNSILISYSTSTKTLRLQIHLKLFKEAFWSWQETSWGLLTGYLVDNLKSAFLTFTNIKNINHQECFFVNLDYYFKVILRLTLLPIVTTHWWQFSIQSTKLNKRPQFIGK